MSWDGWSSPLFQESNRDRASMWRGLFQDQDTSIQSSGSISSANGGPMNSEQASQRGGGSVRLQLPPIPPFGKARGSVRNNSNNQIQSGEGPRCSVQSQGNNASHSNQKERNRNRFTHPMVQDLLQVLEHL